MIDIEEDGPPEADTPWLVTFADLSLLLLTFFILLVTMSTFEIQKFQDVFESMRDAFGGSQMPPLTTSGRLSENGESTAESMQEFMRIREQILKAQRMTYNEIRSFITTKGLEGKMSAVFDEGIVTISVPDSVLFGPGLESLDKAADPVLRNLLTIFQDGRELSINIKGYTDNSPVPAEARYHDNWELSALRAVNVLRWFVEAGLPVVRLTATGMGDLNPLFPNDAPENQARNRRVEFVLERKVGSTQ